MLLWTHQIIVNCLIAQHLPRVEGLLYNQNITRKINYMKRSGRIRIICQLFKIQFNCSKSVKQY
jgi:hypothetical protein